MALSNSSPQPPHAFNAPPATAWSDFRVILFITAIIFLISFNSMNAMTILPRDWFSDGGCYMQRLGDYLGIEGRHVCSEENFRPPGATFLWLPFALLGQWVAHAFNENVTEYITSFIGFGTVLFWAVTLYLIKQITAPFSRSASSYFIALMIFLNMPSTYYTFFRPFMGHAVEAMTAMGVVHFLYRSLPLHALLCATLLAATRYNDAPVFLLFLGWLLDQKKTRVVFKPSTMRTIAFVTSIGLLACVWAVFKFDYYSYTVSELLTDLSFEGVFKFFLSADWGVLWSATWWTASFILGIVFFRRLSNLGRAAALWLILEAILCIGWGGNGSDFGYRYLIGSYAGALIIWMEVLKNFPTSRFIFKPLTVFGGFWVFWMYLLYAIVPNTASRWSDDGLTCVQDTQAVYYSFKYAFDPGYLMQALSSQVLPLNLFFQKHPELANPAWKLTALSPTRLNLALGACAIAIAYILVFLFSAFLHVKKHRKK